VGAGLAVNIPTNETGGLRSEDNGQPPYLYPDYVATLLPDPDRVGGNGADLRRVRCCNRAATGAGHTRTEQENDDAKSAKHCLDKRDFRQGSTHPESFDLTYKEGVAGTNLALPTKVKKGCVLREKRSTYEEGRDGSRPSVHQ